MSRKAKFQIVTVTFFAAIAIGGNYVYNSLFVAPDMKVAAARLDASNAPAAITGVAADKAKAAVLKKYPGSSIDHVQQLRDGSYAVRLTNASGPHHVFVNKQFHITGIA